MGGMGADNHPTTKVMLSIDETLQVLEESGFKGPTMSSLSHADVLAHVGEGQDLEIPDCVKTVKVRVAHGEAFMWFRRV